MGSTSILRLIDSDRGKNKDVLSARIDRCATPGAPKYLNYKLKDVVSQLLHLRMLRYNEKIPPQLLPYEQHVRYLTSDLLGTTRLYQHLIDQLTPDQAAYNASLIAPLTPILVKMTEVGVRANLDYLQTETARLQELMNQISDAHHDQFGLPLGLDQKSMCAWLFGELGLRPTKFKRLTQRERSLGRYLGSPALDTPHLELLRHQTRDTPQAKQSLDLIVAYRQAATLLVGLTKLRPYIDYRDRRIHTFLHPRQATGRISSIGPNLQGIARIKTITGEEFHSRNALMATDGYTLVAFDIKNADVRVMAQAIAQFPRTASEHLKGLHRERLEALRPKIRAHLDQVGAHRNPAYSHQSIDPPEFDPKHPCALRTILED